MSSGKAIKHAHYVALSRARTLNGIFILNLDEGKIRTDCDVSEMERLRNEANIKLNFILPSLLPDNIIKIAFHNARSLHCHFPDISSDHDLLSMHMMVFAESRLCNRDDNDSYSIPEFILHRNDQNRMWDGRRPPHGLALYIKKNLNPFIRIHHTSTHFEASILHLSYTSINIQQFIFLYRSTKCSITELITNLQTIALDINCNIPFVIIGDFNIDANKPENSGTLKRICQIFNCRLYSEEITTDYDSMIDLVFSNATDICTSTIENTWSDHKIVFVSTPKTATHD